MSDDREAPLASKNLELSALTEQFSRPTTVHVAPRIDPDLFQAEIPDFVPPPKGDFC